MYSKPDLSASDLKAYADFWTWCEPAHEQVLNMIGGRTLGPNTYENINAIRRELHIRKLVAQWEAFDCSPAVKAHALAMRNERGLQKPERVDYRASLKSAAESTRDQYGKARAEFQPEGACKLKLKAKEAVRFSYSQEAYADYSSVAVPVEGEVPTDAAAFAACQRNLSELVRRMDSHTGMAGSGSNYSASLVQTAAGWVAIITCRASIMD